MSVGVQLRVTRAVFPFGLLALTFVLISVFAVTFLSHPDNDPQVVQLATYLLMLALVSFIILGIIGINLRSPAGKDYNILGLFVAFFIGLGFQAITRYIFIIPSAFSTVATTYATLPISMELLMFFVATIEELTFRVAIPMWIFLFIPRSAGFLRWVGAVVVSTIAFGAWHYYAYGADWGLVFSAFLAGAMFSLGYRFGEFVGGGELAFLGIVAGHWLWNITVVPSPNAFVYVIAYLLVVVVFVIIINQRARFILVEVIRNPLSMFTNFRRILR